MSLQRTVILVITLLITPLMYGSAMANNQENSFSWSIRYDNSTQPVTNISRQRLQHMDENDRIQFLLQVNSKITVYLLYVNSDGLVNTVLARQLQPSNKPRYIPNKNSWFQFDGEPAIEKFVLVASENSLPEIERLLPQAEKDPKAGKALLGLIKKLRRQHSSLAAENLKPIAIGGTTRGAVSTTTPPEVITFQKFYSKTYRFKH